MFAPNVALLFLLCATSDAFLRIAKRPLSSHVRFSTGETWDPSREEILKQIVEQEESGEEITPEDLPSIDLDDSDDADMRDLDDMDGLNDPRDAPWRLRAEDLIHEAVASVPDLELWDITWNVADLIVCVESPGGGEESPVGLEAIVSANRAIYDKLESVDDELQV